MPEIVHYGGGSTIGLSNVGSDQLATPYILVADQFQNLGPLVPPPDHVDGPSLPQVNFTNTDVHVTGGKLNTQQIAVQGGYSSSMFSISDSLHISKVVTFPTDVPANVNLGAGCVDPHGIIYYLGEMGLGGIDGSVIVQHIAPTNTYSFIPFDYERYFIYAMGATTQSLYLAVYDTQPIFDDIWYVFILETNAFTITGHLDFGAYTFTYPQDIKFDSSGGIYVATTAKIYYFANESSTPTVIDPGRIIYGIAIDSRNYIYAVDTYHGNAFCITTNVTYEPPSDINIGINGPLGIAVDSNFEVYVNFYCADKIIKYFENGTYFYTINLQINLAATRIDIKGFDDLYVWSTRVQTVSVYKSVIEIGKVTRIIGDEFYGDGGTLSNVHVPADSVIQPFSNLKVLGTTVTSNLGIGTETPNFPLHLLLSTDTAQGAYPVSSFGSTSGWDIQFFSDDTLRSAPPYIFAQSSYGLGLAGVTGLIKFYDYNGGQGLIELMRIDSGGYVGIGTSTPGAQLDVVSSSTPDSGALISQFGSTSQSGRIKFYDNNVDTVIPPYIYGDAGAGLGISGLGPVKIFGGSIGPGDPGQQVMEVGLGYTNILGSLQAFGQAGDGVIFTQLIETTGTPHNYIFSSDGSVGTYTLGVNDNDNSINLSSAPKCMVNLTRLENNNENNFHVEFVNKNQNGAHGDYGVGMGFYDNGQRGETISQSPFIINTHVTPWDGHTQVPFLGASDTTSTAIAIAMDGNRNVGINTIPPIQTSGQPVPRYGQLQVATYSNGIDMYTLQVFDNGTPDNKSANAMTALTRTELNTAHPSATDPQPQYHLEFINQPAGSNSYGVGMGFYADPEITGTGSQPFIISAHSQKSGFDDTRNSNGSLDILGSITLATDGSGHVGIGGQLFPAYALDVTGTVNATNSLVTTNVFASNISASGSFGTSGQVLSQTGTGLEWINIPGTVTVHPVTSGSYSVLISDYYIGCNGTGITIVLPLGSTIFTGKQYVIKDESGNALLNNVTINATSPNLIDGNSTVTLYTNYMSLTLLWTGSRWSIV